MFGFGIWKTSLIGEFICNGTFISEKYADILCAPVPDFLEQYVSLQDLSQMSFQLDGVLARRSHFWIWRGY